MASISKHARSGWYCTVYVLPGKRERIYLGHVSKGFAQTFADRVAKMQAANGLNVPDHALNAWAIGLRKSIRSKMIECGILRVRNQQEWTVDTWTQHVIDQYVGKPRTIKNLKSARNHWVSAIGSLLLTEVTTGHCRTAVDRILASGAPSYAVRICERGRMFFQRAVENELIQSNPVDGIEFGSKKHDKTRQNYVTKEVFELVRGKATNREAESLFCLARYCGLRVPSEPLALTWSDVDWELGRLRVPDETKTGQRVVPLFPPCLDLLRKLYEAAPEGATWIFTRARASSATTWRNWLIAAINAAKVKQWEKLWVNMRASCRTDLEDEYPVHVCDAWLGHSAKVAKDHYAMVTPEHWERAKCTAQELAARRIARREDVSEVV